MAFCGSILSSCEAVGRSQLWWGTTVLPLILLMGVAIGAAMSNSYYGWSSWGYGWGGGGVYYHHAV